ncbi:hypothetical protein TVAG_086030 [Trichomonas vaginalis G3]|uniref:Uncharacterized protein n=1 Tax=Trichomonas vaginalis (strain ATCC PRA-98 / G3) TaxID=412133 RepID=A2FXY9_TRIV3|nr:hypothetical protein TVAGG3_0587430 [Trichomonas vaginalis G3]EAX90230.1 hypothetical protein TVAG_086030 [Trichomonas vaginalis G3]KAI5522998.1 hypothetical protein TVAGG3_0587430 [Trichomonas vaginalis G3]|eukprot:XP_001303160.1 hypothetical protein [Trichomonas vaginalis G3]
MENIPAEILNKNIFELSEEELQKYIPDFENFENDYEDMWDYVLEVKDKHGEDDTTFTVKKFLGYYLPEAGFIPEPPPPPEREEVKPKSADDFKYLNYVKNVKRVKDDSELLRLRVENDKLKKENRELKNRLKEELKKEVDYRIDYKHYLQSFYNEGAEFMEKLEPKEENKIDVRNYKQWKALNSDDNQKTLSYDKWDVFMRNPYENVLELRDLTSTGRKTIFPLLKEWIEEYLGQTSAENKYMFCFRVNYKWHSKPLTPELFRELKEKFTYENF